MDLDLDLDLDAGPAEVIGRTNRCAALLQQAEDAPLCPVAPQAVRRIAARSGSERRHGSSQEKER
ncbi:hypothetical protein [Streptomyces shenzhenensis]|uniref:hypothetical protein n=1 Tax=Streptomyces shenzhenensis TaxID=943815 RepID=UPI003696D8A2